MPVDGTGVVQHSAGRTVHRRDISWPESVDGPATPFVRAVALDYDGTLTVGGRPELSVLATLAAVRASGRKVVLVTGRILEELRVEYPDVDAHVDALVSENGAVLTVGSITRALVAPVGVHIANELVRAGYEARAGRVLVATNGAARRRASELIGELHLDHQLIANRGELMILPAGISKATGLAVALDELGLSIHNTIAVGDAENDLALLHACEMGVAVANAVDSVREEADVVTSASNGAGVVELLSGPILDGRTRVHAARWRLAIGEDSDGVTVTIPGSQVNVLIRGASGSGKSYLAGLLVEQLVRLGYVTLVVDPEGDHHDLVALPGVVDLGGDEPLPPANAIGRLLAAHRGAVVVDLSTRSEREVAAFWRSLPGVVEHSRNLSGTPQWVIVDEAHRSLGAVVTRPSSILEGGYCAITYRPQDLDVDVAASFDVDIELGSGSATGTAVVWRTNMDPATVRIAARSTTQIRHHHKYATGLLSHERGFHFRRDDRHPTGAVARRLSELVTELRCCPDEVLLHHAAGGDLSRWIADVYRDPELAGAVARHERRLRHHPNELDDVRRALIDRVSSRLLP